MNKNGQVEIPVTCRKSCRGWGLRNLALVHELTQGELVGIDGKTLRGSYNREDRLSTIHMISA